ncbi:serine/threonine protein kinase [Spirulina sp. CS-785/01]|uniref:serine/threonine protein kinase n=1 Tax=Spirulina sp. CS-785/01 TaxID=3021716 RepID=UPI00232A96E5|nr:serine/threonine protein kinase [Spirulina sp. CS-785/01]MDB9314758.1 serine/threonine protein kinase [Spirulina sp. CS-785/01]
MQGKLLDGRYRVLRVLGAGGFGQTYLAQDTRRPGHPQCVVKQLKPVSQDRDVLSTARRLFQREAETLERLGTHEQIPRLLAYFEEDQEFYLVQDYIAGHSLTEDLQEGQPWDENAVVGFLVELLPVLAFFHSQGAIHRDIKPDNILRRHRDGRLILIDFGAVKQIQLPSTFVGQAPTTQTIAIGTPGYMSSEQARGKPHFSSDIYGLGVIALQALTGVRPHNFKYDAQTGEIDWQQSCCSPALAAVLNRMVAYHFRDRYQSAQEVYNVLTQVQPKPSKTKLPPVQSPPPAAASAASAAPPPPSTPPPAAPPTPSYAATTPASPSPQKPASPAPKPAIASSSKSPNLTLLLLGSILVVIFSVVFGAAVALNNLTKLRTGQTPTTGGGESSFALGGGKKSGNNTCIVMADNGLNVRATPDGEKVGGVAATTELTVTGNKQGKWLEISSPVQGWVYGDRRYVQCTSSSFIETNNSPSPSPPSPTPVADHGKDLLATAREQLESGKIQDAIAQLSDIPSNSQVYRDAQTLLTQWSRIQERYKAMEEAIGEQRWDDILADINTNGYPDSSYWKEQFKELVQRARQQKLEAENETQPPFNEDMNATPSPESEAESEGNLQSLDKPPKPDFSTPVVEVEVLEW